MKNYIIYNGLHSIEDMNVLIDALSIPSINEVIENIDVEGRNGSLTIRHGNYLDRIIPFKFTLIRDINEPIESFIDRADIVLNWLELEDNNELITYFLAVLHGLWDLSSTTRDQACTRSVLEWILSHWTAREVPVNSYLPFRHPLTRHFL